MNDTEARPPRRPLVPGPGQPSQSGIAAKAVALREQKATPQALGALPPPPTDQEAMRAGREALRVGFGTPAPIGKIAGAIAGVMSEIGSIPKTGYNKFHGYHYATLPDLLHVLTPLMGKHGIAVFQSEVETKTIENRIAVTYEFMVAHSSGESWPERLRFTGMAMGRDGKGNWDDKAINKCHSAARKYFLLALFQVPTGDFEDADEGPATSLKQPTAVERATPIEQTKSPKRTVVPGPTTPSAAQPQQPVADERTPRKIVLGQGAGPDQWAATYLKGLETSKDADEVAQWDRLNDTTLQALNERFPLVYDQINAVTQRLLTQFAPSPVIGGMPDPVADPQAAMNWVAEQLMNMKTHEAAMTFWNKTVAPREQDFDTADWDLLMNEWRRTDLRLNPEADEPEPE